MARSYRSTRRSQRPNAGLRNVLKSDPQLVLAIRQISREAAAQRPPKQT